MSTHHLADYLDHMLEAAQQACLYAPLHPTTTRIPQSSLRHLRFVNPNAG